MWKTATIGVYSMQDKGKKPSEKYEYGALRVWMKAKIFLYNKGLITKLDYENRDGGTTYRRRTQSFSKKLLDRFG